MVKQSTLDFLNDLKNNNSRNWMDENKNQYVISKDNILELAALLLRRIAGFDRTISDHTDPKKCISRLNRDLRFSKNKIPYKSGYFIVINKNGKKSTAAYYYLYIEPGKSFYGAGLWNPLPEELKKLRDEINFFFDDWMVLIDQKQFKLSFPSGVQSEASLINVPKPFEKDNAAAEFLKMKGFCTREKLTDEQVINEAFIEKIISHYENAKPLVNFLNQTLETT